MSQTQSASAQLGQPHENPIASLRPASQPSPAEAGPYQTVTLRITNTNQQTARQVTLREATGGPRLLFSLTVLPGQTQQTTIYLPADKVQQQYNVQLHADDAWPNWNPTRRQWTFAKPLVTTTASLQWPAERVNADTFFDRASYREILDDYPTWPSRTKQSYLLAGLLFVLCLIGSSLIKRRPLQILIFCILTAAFVSWCSWQMNRETLTFQEARGEQWLVRSRQHAIVDLTKNCYPLYFASWQLQEDSLVMQWDSRRWQIKLPCSPDKPRLFKLITNSVK